MGRLMGFLAAAAMIFSMTSVAASASNTTLAALGDSLSTGYGLADYGVYPNENKARGFAVQTAEKLGYGAVNLGVDGLTSQQLLEGVKALEGEEPQYKSLSEAEVITLTIGGNDILNALYSQLGGALGLLLSSPDFKSQLSTAISKTFAGLKGDADRVVEKIDGATARFQQEAIQLTLKYGENLKGIVNRVREINPEGILVVQTIPNLYFGVPFVSGACDWAVKAFNEQIVNYSKSLDYIVADVYTSFEASYLKSPYLKLTNALAPKTFMDPHPNATGHELMARVTFEALKTGNVNFIPIKNEENIKMISIPLIEPFAKLPVPPQETVNKAVEKIQEAGRGVAKKWHEVTEKFK